MIQLFQFAPNDQSLIYLYRLFGSMNGAIPTPGGGSTSGELPLSMLGQMFQTFNSVILAVGALIVVYTTVVGVMLTAHEGQFMGKNWNNMWIPIRTVLGIAALVPSQSGFSGIQILLMWIIVQGIGAADTLWGTVLTYVNVVGTPYTKITMPSIKANQTISKLFQALTCDEAARRSYANPMPNDDDKGSYYCATHANSSFCTSSPPDFEANKPYALGPAMSCGMLFPCSTARVCNTNDKSQAANLKCIACQGQQQGLKDIIPTLRKIASEFVDKDYIYTKYWMDTFVPLPGFGNKGQNLITPTWIQDYCNDNNISDCKAMNLPRPGILQQNMDVSAVNNVLWPYGLKPIYGEDFLQTNVAHYMGGISKAVNDYISAQQKDPTKLSDTLKIAGVNGWALAGAFYYVIAQMNKNNLENAMPDLGVLGNDPQTLQGGILYNYRNDYGVADNLISSARSKSASGGDSLNDTVEGLGKISDSIDSAMGTVSEAMAGLNAGTGGVVPDVGNPISFLATLGQTMIMAAEALFVSFLALTAVLTLVGYFNVFVLGNGVDNPVGPTVSTMYYMIVPAMLALVGILITFGGLLAVYLPLVPYIIFSFGVIGWMISTIEAMIAGPLVALGILSPSGQHELLGKAEPAIMLIFYIFLRPSLMIFGLMSAMLLIVIVFDMINLAYWGVIQSVAGANLNPYDPVTWILFILTYIFFILTAFNKCFAAIYIIPQQVMIWIGGHHAARDEGVGSALEEAKGGAQRAAGGLAGGMRGLGGMTKQTAEASKKTSDQKQAPGITNQGTPPPAPEDKGTPPPGPGNKSGGS